MRTLIPEVIAVGVFAIGIGLILFLIGRTIPKDKPQNMGFGTHMSRGGWLGRAILVVIIGVLAAVVGFFL